MEQRAQVEQGPRSRGGTKGTKKLGHVPPMDNAKSQVASIFFHTVEQVEQKEQHLLKISIKGIYRGYIAFIRGL